MSVADALLWWTGLVVYVGLAIYFGLILGAEAYESIRIKLLVSSSEVAKKEKELEPKLAAHAQTSL